MIIEQYYLSNTPIERVIEDTGLAQDEIESIVGRFASHSHRKGLLRGKVCIYFDKVQIRKCFGNKLLWENNERL